MSGYETICAIHSDIKWEIEQYLKDKNQEHLIEALAQLKRAKRAGQRMEKRLQKYCFAIERLGFERKR